MIGRNLHRDLVAYDATIVAPLAASNFRVRLDNGHEITCRPAGKMQLSHVMIVAGDRVVVELPVRGSLSKGRIVYRFSGEASTLKLRGRRRAARGGRARKDADVTLA